MHIIKFLKKGCSLWLFVLVKCLGAGEGLTKHCSMMNSLLHTSPFPKGPHIAVVLSEVKIKTRKRTMLSNNRVDTFFPLNKSALSFPHNVTIVKMHLAKSKSTDWKCYIIYIYIFIYIDRSIFSDAVFPEGQFWSLELTNTCGNSLGFVLQNYF